MHRILFDELTIVINGLNFVLLACIYGIDIISPHFSGSLLAS